MKGIYSTLTWGISLPEINKTLPDAPVVTMGEYEADMLSFGNLRLYNFPGDCGALCVTGVNTITEEEMKAVLKYASLSGFNKLFATVVTHYPEKPVAIFKKYKWKLSYKGNSNRNPEKTEFVFVKYIRNPIHKGY